MTGHHWQPTYVDHHRHVHVTDNPALLEADAWPDGPPDVVIWAPDGIENGARVTVEYPSGERREGTIAEADGE